MKKKFSSIRYQLVLIFLIITVLLSSVVVFVSIHYLGAISQKEAASRTLIKSEQINTQINMLLGKAENIFEWSLSENVFQFLTAEGDRHLEAVELIRNIAMYRNSSLLDDSIRNVYLIDPDGLSYDEHKGVYTLSRYEKSLIVFETVQKEPNRILYIPGAECHEPDDFLVLGRPVYMYATQSIIGYVAVEFRKDVFEEYLLSEQETDSFFWIENENGLPAFGSMPFPGKSFSSISYGSESGYSIIRINGKKGILTRQTVPYTGWTLNGLFLMDAIPPDVLNAGILVLTTALLGVLVSVVAYQHITKRLTQPIYRMKESMLRVAGGDLNAQIESPSQGEFRVLEVQYNRMLERIRNLIEQNREDQKALQKAEFAALQAQIAPHFLYNTLDTIIWLVAVNENEKAMEMIEKLSVFFKTGLSKGMEWVSVETEIQHVQSYLYLQQSRYNDMLAYEIDVPESLYGYDMLKMTLQPIVENAIYHGIKNTDDGGIIRIRGYRTEQYLIFEIQDTGAGMEKAEAEKLNAQMRENLQSFEDKENGFGLYNVNRRIRLYYGDSCGLSIISSKDEGTTVLIRMLCMSHHEHESEEEAYVQHPAG